MRGGITEQTVSRYVLTWQETDKCFLIFCSHSIMRSLLRRLITVKLGELQHFVAGVWSICMEVALHDKWSHLSAADSAILTFHLIDVNVEITCCSWPTDAHRVIMCRCTVSTLRDRMWYVLLSKWRSVCESQVSQLAAAEEEWWWRSSKRDWTMGGRKQLELGCWIKTADHLRWQLHLISLIILWCCSFKRWRHAISASSSTASVRWLISPGSETEGLLNKLRGLLAFTCLMRGAGELGRGGPDQSVN